MSSKRGNKRARAPLPAPRPKTGMEGRGDQPRPSSVTFGTQIRHTRLEVRRGPIPDAAELRRYGEAHPDAPAMILNEFQAQGAHRRHRERAELELERRALEAAVTSERLGVACALAIALAGFGCATFLIAAGHSTAGIAIFGLDVVALVSAFILGRPRSVSPPRPHTAAGV
jgi:uncharacterized membrane protein